MVEALGHTLPGDDAHRHGHAGSRDTYSRTARPRGCRVRRLGRPAWSWRCRSALDSTPLPAARKVGGACGAARECFPKRGLARLLSFCCGRRPGPSRQEAVRCLWGRPGVLHVPRALPGRAPGTPPNGEEHLYDEGLEYDMGWKAWWTDSVGRSELTESTAGEALLDMLRPEGGPESLAILERVSGRHPVLAAFHLPAGQSFLPSECGARCGSLCHAGWWARRRWRTGAAGGRPLPRDQVLPWLHVHW